MEDILLLRFSFWGSVSLDYRLFVICVCIRSLIIVASRFGFPPFSFPLALWTVRIFDEVV